MVPDSPLPPVRRPGPGRRWFSPRVMAANAVRAALLLGPPVGITAGIGAAFGGTGLLTGLIVGAALAAACWWGCERLVLAAAGARPIDPARHPLVVHLVSRLSTQAWMPRPRLYTTPDRRPNAFATGRDPDHAAIVFSEGLLELLDSDELEAVIAHELAHIGNRDTLPTSITAGVAVALGRWPTVRAGLARLGRSRRRELEADRTAARLLGDGDMLARALTAIDRAWRRPPAPDAGRPALTYAIEPLAIHPVAGGRMATHPSTGERVVRLTTGAWRSHR